MAFRSTVGFLTFALICAAAPLSGQGTHSYQEVIPASLNVHLPGGTTDGGDLYEMPVGMGGGFAAADYDNDGDIDLFLPNKEEIPDRLLRNDGSGVFTDVADSAGVSGLPSGFPPVVKPRSRVGLWLDYDSDRRLDLFVLGDSYAENASVTGAPGFGETCDPVLDPFDIPELVAPQAKSWSVPRLYRQLPDGTFTDVSVTSGVALVNFAEFARFDRFSPDPADECSNQIEVGGVAAGDVNGDGMPDIVVNHWGLGAADQGTAIFVSDASTLTYSLEFTDSLGGDDCGGGASYWTPLVHDFTGDGRLDIYHAVDFGKNQLWRNDGFSTSFPEDCGEGQKPFTDIGTSLSLNLDPTTEACLESSPLCVESDVNDPNNPFDFVNDDPVAHSGTNMGIAVGDYDNDGHFDFYITNSNEACGKLDVLLHAVPGSPVKYTDRLAVSCIKQHVEPSDVSPPSILSGSWGWGVTFFDGDLDGWVDLCITNGFSGLVNTSSTGPNTDSTLFFLNTIPSQAAFPFLPDFVESSASWNLDDTYYGSALGALDFDRDGALDLAQTTQVSPVDADSQFRLLQSQVDVSSTNWLVVRPRLTTRNAHSIGAVVRLIDVDLGDGTPRTLSRLITAGVSFMTQEPAEAHFGLGASVDLSQPITVRIEWPAENGAPLPPSEFQVSAVNQVVTYGWASEVDVASPYGVLDQADLNELVSLWVQLDPRADLAPPFGVFDVSDLTEAGVQVSQGAPAGTNPVMVTDLP